MCCALECAPTAKMPKSYSKDTRQFVVNLVAYFEKERQEGGPLLSVDAVQERVANALKIGKATVSRICHTANRNTGSSTATRKPHVAPVVTIDPSTEIRIRNVIYEMYSERMSVTLDSLLAKLRDKGFYDGGRSSLAKIVHNLGFKWKKDCNRRALFELHHITMARVRFLREYVANATSNTPLQCVYLDETWIFEKGSAIKSWQDGTAKSVRRKTTTSDGKRYIIVHAGTVNGFVPEAELLFHSKTTGDYHGEMNTSNFLQWFEEQLLRPLEEPSLIIMDNAPYHSSLLDMQPTSTWRKAKIQDWLTNNNIVFDRACLKVELLQIARQNRQPKRYVADELAAKYGHRVLRLPPYHCIFNPIEHIWGIAKSYYNKHIGRDGYGATQTLNMWKEALATITPTIWQNTINHTNNVIQEWWDRERLMDHEDIAPLVIHANAGSSSDTDSEKSD